MHLIFITSWSLSTRATNLVSVLCPKSWEKGILIIHNIYSWNWASFSITLPWMSNWKLSNGSEMTESRIFLSMGYSWAFNKEDTTRHQQGNIYHFLDSYQIENILWNIQYNVQHTKSARGKLIVPLLWDGGHTNLMNKLNKLKEIIFCQIRLVNESPSKPSLGIIRACNICTLSSQR